MDSAVIAREIKLRRRKQRGGVLGRGDEEWGGFCVDAVKTAAGTMSSAQTHFHWASLNAHFHLLKRRHGNGPHVNTVPRSARCQYGAENEGGT